MPSLKNRLWFGDGKQKSARSPKRVGEGWGGEELCPIQPCPVYLPACSPVWREYTTDYGPRTPSFYQEARG
jgi:hypothetical protein